MFLAAERVPRRGLDIGVSGSLTPRAHPLADPRGILGGLGCEKALDVSTEATTHVRPTAAADRPPLFTWLILPTLVAAIGFASWALLTKSPLPRPAASSLPVLACALVIWGLEYRFPAQRAWNRRPDTKDLVLLVVNRLLDAALLGTMVTVMGLVTERFEVRLPWPTHWPVAAQVVMGIAIAEMIRYALHRWSHRPGFLWRVHRTHHEPNRMYVLNGPRLHPVNYFWVAGAHAITTLALGAELDVVLVLVNVTALFVIFQHSNLELRFDGLNRFLATPDVHRLHHARDMPARGVNYSVVLLAIDRLFGTYAAPRPVPADGIGLSDVSSRERLVR